VPRRRDLAGGSSSASDADREAIIRVVWADGSRDILLKARSDGEVISLQAAPNDPRVFVLDPDTCSLLASTPLVRQANWFSLVEGTTPDGVSDGILTVSDGAKGVEPGEFLQLIPDTRCAAT
jgi:hypothetical protein